MKVLNIIGAVCWGILLLGTIVGVVEPTRVMYGIAVSVLTIEAIGKVVSE